ncbi:MAG: lysylphosphatidylglycerol synthase transmembrane domain-containing protein, partial [Anaerolineales bacterium]
MSVQNSPRRNRKIQWRFLAGLALSLVLLFLAFRQTDWGQMWALFQAADRGLLLAAFFVNLLGLVLRAGRWRLLFWQQEHLPFSAFLDSVNIGYLVNNLFPVRLGDVVRSILLGRWLDLGVARAFSATVIERVLDSGIVLVLFFSLFLVLPLPAFALNLGLMMALAVALAIAIMLVVLWQQKRAERWLRALLDRI